jgi:hypothetical protein
MKTLSIVRVTPTEVEFSEPVVVDLACNLVMSAGSQGAIGGGAGVIATVWPVVWGGAPPVPGDVWSALTSLMFYGAPGAAAAADGSPRAGGATTGLVEADPPP